MILKRCSVFILLAIMVIALSVGSPIAVADEPSYGLFTGEMEHLSLIHISEPTRPY